MARILLQQSQSFTHGLQTLGSRCVKLQVRKVCLGLTGEEKPEGHAVLTLLDFVVRILLERAKVLKV